MHFVRSHEVEDILDIAQDVYRQPFKRSDARLFCHRILGSPDTAFMRLNDSVIVASIVEAYFGGPRRCFLMYVFGKDGPTRIWDVMKLLRAVEDWRKHRGAESFHFGEDTGIDFTPLAKRLGAKLDKPTWKIEGGHREMTGELSPRLSVALSGGGRLSALAQAMGS